MNACVDFMTVYKQHVANQPQSTQLLAPYSLRLLPLYILALMKNVSIVVRPRFPLPPSLPPSLPLAPSLAPFLPKSLPPFLTPSLPS